MQVAGDVLEDCGCRFGKRMALSGSKHEEWPHVGSIGVQSWIASWES